MLLVGTHNSGASRIMSVGEGLYRQLRDKGWQVSLTSTRGGRMARVADMLATAFRRRDAYDVAVVDVYSGRAFLWAEAVVALVRRLGKRVVLVLRGGNLPDFAARRRARVMRLLQSAHSVVAPSHYLRDALEFVRSDIRLIPNPIDVRAFSFRHRASVEPRLIWLRAFHALYDPVLAVEVIDRVRAARPDAHLTMIGPDMHDGSLEDARRHAEALGVFDRITWQGGVPHTDVAAYLQEGDVFLNTPRIDNVPVSVLEAMATGLCVVSTNAGGLPHLLSHEEDALLSDPGDAAAMAAAVERLLAHPKLAARLSENARAKAERFDWEAVRGQWEDLLTEVATKTP